MKKKSNHDPAALNSELIRRPIRRCFWLFLLPTFIAFTIGFLWPFCQGIYLSFCKFKTIKKASFVGLDNYVKALADPGFVHSFWFTVLYTVTTVILINLIAFAVAYVLTRGIKGSNLFRTVFFMPNLIGGIVLGYIWSMIFDGVLSHFGTALLLQQKFGFWGLVILVAWQQIGYMMIVYIAGINAVSDDIMEAAHIDGANSWQTLKSIIIPNVMPSITICTFLTLTNGFKLFDQNLALTEGRPFSRIGAQEIKTTEMMALNIYNSFYASGGSNRGVGQAKAVMFFILVAVISIIQLNATRSKEVQA